MCQTMLACSLVNVQETEEDRESERTFGMGSFPVGS
jgi:hypothetical protein